MFFGEYVSKRTAKSAAWWLFLIGLFSQTQLRLGAKIGISELFCCLIAPFLFLSKYAEFKRDKVTLYFWLLIFWIFGAILSDYINGSFAAQVIRGFSGPVTIFSVSVCVYYNLRKNANGLKWLLFGIACSSVLSIFVFQRGHAGDLAAEGDMSGAVEAIIGYKLFWANTLMTWLTLPLFVSYLKVPRFYAVFVMAGLSVFNLLTGGRSMFLVSMFSLVLLILCGKKSESMRNVKKAFPIILAALLGLGLMAKYTYQYAVKEGWMGEAEMVKYETQSQKGTGILALLMSGRADFFIGLIAALDKPLIGQGSQALDFKGYAGEFLAKYGTDQEIQEYSRNQMKANGAVRTIQSHSHVICYWMWHGVTALLFWLYVLYLSVITFKNRMHYIPEWFGYFAITLPAFFWDYFFSPFGLRVNECALYCTLLYLVKIDNDRKRGYVMYEI